MIFIAEIIKWCVVAVALFAVCLYLPGRLRCVDIKNYLKEVIAKRGGRIQGGRWFGYPVYHMEFSGTQLSMSMFDPGRAGSGRSTMVCVGFPAEASHDFSIKIKPAANFNLMPGHAVQIDNKEFPAQLAVYSDDDFYAKNILTEEIANKIRFLFEKQSSWWARFFTIYYDARKYLVIDMPGIPSCAADIEQTLDVSIALYDKIKVLEKSFQSSTVKLKDAGARDQDSAFWALSFTLGLILNFGVLIFILFFESIPKDYRGILNEIPTHAIPTVKFFTMVVLCACDLVFFLLSSSRRRV